MEAAGIQQLRSLSIHLRVEVLWLSLGLIEHHKATICLDPDNYMDLMKSHEANMGGSLGFDPETRTRTWRNIDLKMLHPPLEAVDFDAKIEDAGIAKRTPFCIYIEYEKPNGRRLYIDDPETDKVFL